ncbi:hypothetical protein FHL15_000951 [Xylaria flabelliformis]|uniref:Ribonuclease H1 N-terminal domain-containing protein n=1 Tax=Xylaria flabelliformis TaxID=2512241 RepID=A0A553IDN4_9PEZI|nr:hypothetical protein FHL15_000951 [Xylaria flabelliformis]
MAKNRKNYYGVREGRIPGVYDWKGCRAQTKGCANQHRGFNTYDEAAFYVATGQTCNGDNGSRLFDEWKRTRLPSSSSNIVKKEEKPRIKVEAFSASQSYFSQVPNFQPDSNADFDDEFGRFASSQDIMPGSQAWRRKRTDAIRHEMVFHYSQKTDSGAIKEEDEYDLSEAEKLEIFQNMCREVDLEPLDTINGCVSNLKSVLVNIVDYIDAKRNARPIKVWGPHEFHEFRRYTLSPQKRIDQHTAKMGDGLLEPLLQVLRTDNAARVYQSRRNHAAVARKDCAMRARGDTFGCKTEQHVADIKKESSTTDEIPEQDHEVISIHGTESDYSSSPQPIKEEIAEACPWSPSSISSSVIEILINSQSEVKRDLHDFLEDEDISENENTSTRIHKRLRVE